MSDQFARKKARWNSSVPQKMLLCIGWIMIGCNV